ncbi:MAG TPA: amino acid ABC transporter substrate-binding protein [Clostridia bacterium]|jgi:polar amino acid transport system substrate-binding protein|nr:amino acid ABC transporter substrate-binding protein [Clostridia bacterium]
MKKLRFSLILILILTMTLSMILTGCGGEKQQAQQNEQTGDGSLQRVKDAGKLVAGLDDAFPPMGYRNDKNELVGFDIDFGNELAKRLGVEMEWQPTDWNGVILSLQSKKFDIILSGMSITEERKQAVNFSTPYIATDQVVVVKSSNDEIKTVEDLKGKIIGTQLGSTGEKSAKTIPDLDEKNLKLYSAYTEAFTDLAIGRLDAMVVDELTARHYMTQKPGEFKVTDISLSYEPMGIAVRKEDKELLDAINQAIDDMRADGTLGKISEKWFGEDITKDVK